ncbi:laccase precursor [Pseudozyma hubeiensis SY62]|uniref:Laccase n=1 Tax=Pseudozyma hubeiensis (strain SY62) TaxID=1305764 RepID=R9PCC0_PSEHS|nr:laccase precursor [Pseudozyma hubeiensis SY62]GAC98857.1 laccase precursor [Pseudozyma hubeiensis SY62]
MRTLFLSSRIRSRSLEHRRKRKKTFDAPSRKDRAWFASNAIYSGWPTSMATVDETGIWRFHRVADVADMIGQIHQNRTHRANSGPASK